MRRKTSASVRTVVVLPVPPFSDRTAMVSAMGPQPNVRGSLRPPVGAPRGALLDDRGGRHVGDGTVDRGAVHVVDRVAPDDDLVPVGERGPLHAAPVHVDAVQGPVVEHAYPV